MQTVFAVIKDYSVVIDGQTCRFAIPITGPSSASGRLFSDLKQGKENINGNNSCIHSKVDGRLLPAEPLKWRGSPVYFAKEWSYRDQWAYQIPETFHVNVTVTQRGFYHFWHSDFDRPEPRNGAWREHREEIVFVGVVTSKTRSIKVQSTTWSRNELDPEWKYSGTGGWIWPLEPVTQDVQYCAPNWGLIVEKIVNQNQLPPGLMSDAYCSAAKMVSLDQNQIANAKDYAEFAVSATKFLLSSPSRKVASVVKQCANPKRAGSFIKSALASGWLGYRYAYSTTKSDVDELKSKAYRLQSVPDLKIVRGGGVYGNNTYHVTVTLKDRKQNALAELHRKLHTIGAAITPVNVWDMIPFSFVVDWFLPIGSSLSTMDADFFYHSVYYDVLSSVESQKIEDSVVTDTYQVTVTRYERKVLESVPTLTLYEEDPSRKTVVKRAMDAAALILS